MIIRERVLAVNKLIFIFALLFLGACSSIEFKQAGEDQYAISARPLLTRTEVKDGVCEIYFWGTFPAECKVDLEKEFVGRGLNEPAFVRVSQSYSFSNVLMTVLTLGIYAPVSYQVSVYSKQEMR